MVISAEKNNTARKGMRSDTEVIENGNGYSCR